MDAVALEYDDSPTMGSYQQQYLNRAGRLVFPSVVVVVVHSTSSSRSVMGF
jgi:hypothetical protein